jgi:hypothetical protein
MSKVTIIRPKGEERDKLIAKIGRDFYVYSGSPEFINVRTPEGIVKAWKFDFKLLEPPVRIVMVLIKAAERGISLDKADAYLTRVGIAIPIEQIDLEDGEIR